MEKLIQILKLIRPKFYYRITWLIISSGILVLSPSITKSLLDYFFQKKFDVNIIGEYNIPIGIFLVLAGIAYNIIFHLTEHKNKERVDIDRNIFLGLNDLISETSFSDILDRLIGDEAITTTSNSQINGFIKRANTTAFSYSKSKIEKYKKNFVQDLDKLMTFVCTEFFSHPNPSVDLMVMRPTTNIDRGVDNTYENMHKHRTLKAELRDYAFTAEKSFNKYRKQAKKYLLV